MDHLKLPNDKELAKAIVDADTKKSDKLIDRGWFGVAFGTGPEKSGNVAGFVAIMSFTAFCYILVFGEDRQGFTVHDQALLILSVVTSSLSFMFGKASAK